MKTLLIQSMTITALLLLDLANDWMTIDYGLNPTIALPIATVLLGLPLLWDLATWLHNREHGLETITLHTGNCARCGRHKSLVNGRCVDGCARP